MGLGQEAHSCRKENAMFTVVEGKDFGDVKIYALSTCGWCRKTKAYLKEHGVKYAYVDVDLLAGAARETARAEQERFNPRGSFPTIVIDGKDCIVGFDEEALESRFGG
jgi:glutaredoxin-like protein NrdH